MREVEMALELFGMVLCVLLLMNCVHGKRMDKQTRLFLSLIVLNFISLATDVGIVALGGTEASDVLLLLLGTVLFSSGYLMLALYTYYLLVTIRKFCRASLWIGHVVAAGSIVMILLLVVSLFHPLFFRFENGVYLRERWFGLCLLYPLLAIAAGVASVFVYRKALGARRVIILMMYAAIPFAAVIVQMATPGVVLTFVATTYTLLLAYLRVYIDQRQKLREQELELAKLRESMLLSQIRPHFLYNVLTTIQALCMKDPERAREALGDFSKFLRGNMGSLSSQTPIPFSRELEHVRHYLNLEKLRYEEKLRIEYEITYEDFFLPALTLQPIVENAVKHGIGGKENGDTIRIRTEKTTEGIRVLVEDDGVGFSEEELHSHRKDEKRSHIGMENVRQRVADMVGGTLRTESTPGVGTRVTVLLPGSR